MNNSRKRTLAIAGVLVFSLAAAACSSSTKSTTAPTTGATATTAASASSAAPTTAATGSSTAPASSDVATTVGDTSSSAVDYSKLKGTLTGSGSTFTKAFLDEAIANFTAGTGLTIQYGGGGSGKGRTDLQTQLVDYAGTDGTVKAEDVPKYAGGAFVYIPTVIAPITVSYNLKGVDKLQLSPKTLADIFQTTITKWSDPEIATDNPGVTLPDTAIVVAHRSDGSGTTQNFTKFLDLAVGTGGDGTWKLGSGSTVEWAAGTQAGDGNSGVAQIISSTEGAVGYVDLSDAKAAGLSFASVKNKAGKFIEPTLEATSAAAENVKVADDLTFFLGWADGDTSYPIAAQTWIIVYTKQADAQKATNLKAFLTYLLTDGQKLAPKIDYAPLPASLVTKALANIAKIGS